MENIECAYWQLMIEVANKQLTLLEEQLATEQMKQRLLQNQLQQS